MLFSKSQRTIDEHEQLDDALDTVQVAGCGIQGCQQVDGNRACCFLALLSTDAVTKLSDPWLAVFLGDVTGHEQKLTALYERNKCSHGSCNCRKRNVKCFQCFVCRHGFLLSGFA